MYYESPLTPCPEGDAAAVFGITFCWVHTRLEQSWTAPLPNMVLLLKAVEGPRTEHFRGNLGPTKRYKAENITRRRASQPDSHCKPRTPLQTPYRFQPPPNQPPAAVTISQISQVEPPTSQSHHTPSQINATLQDPTRGLPKPTPYLFHLPYQPPAAVTIPQISQVESPTSQSHHTPSQINATLQNSTTGFPQPRHIPSRTVVMSPVAPGGRHLLLLMVVLLCLLGVVFPVRLQGKATRAHFPAVSVGAYFLSPGSRNITATVGQTAYLPCRVAELAGQVQQVSWIRKRDLHVISSGVVVFASDQRFQVVHPEKSENWTLQIRFAQVRDAGVYECQVNTEPKMSLAYNLAVVESRARLLGPEYVRAGSTLNLTCIVTPPAAAGLVYWYHNGVMLDYEGPVAILTQESPEGTRSSLTIARAAPVHSGNYTC